MRQEVFVKLRGLPFDVERQDVLDFLDAPSLKKLTVEDVAFRYKRSR